MLLLFNAFGGMGDKVVTKAEQSFEPTADLGLFSSQLVSQQIKAVLEVGHTTDGSEGFTPYHSLDGRDKDLPWKWPPISEEEEWFRHSGWSDARKRVQGALRAAAVPASRMERFDNCGCDCVLEYSAELQRYRLRANYCGDRFCQPCARARSHRIVENLTKLIGDRTVRFVTLTLARDDRGLKERLDDLLASFTRLRSAKGWRAAVTAGAYFIEITRGLHGDFWHVHLHALVAGTYLDKYALGEMWKKASKGSIITDIRKVPDVEGMVGYVAKYATKAVSHDVILQPGSLTEAVEALRGRRLLGTFGEWRGVPDLDISVDYRTYKRVATLSQVVRASRCGETWATGALISLGRLKMEKGDRDNYGRSG